VIIAVVLLMICGVCGKRNSFGKLGGLSVVMVICTGLAFGYYWMWKA
jgi:hypothetical protein